MAEVHMSDDASGTIWTLQVHGRQVTCVVQLGSDGVHVHILSGGSPIVSTLFPSHADALAWAEAEREAWFGHDSP